MYLVGHTLSQEKIDKIFKAEKDLFDLPLEIKKEIPIFSGGFTRGYIGVANESGSSLNECKEAFSYGYNWDKNEKPRNPLQGPNVFPKTDLLGEDWVDTLNDFYNEMVSISLVLVKIFSKALGMDLMKFCEEGETISLMRFFHYFPYKNREKLNGQEWIGSSEHTDWGFLTLLLQDDVGGLQLKNQKGEWIDVPYLEGSIMVNCGDYLSMLTGKKYISPIHRVVNKTEDKERYSIVFFYYPSYDSKIENENEPEIHNVKYGDYLLKKWDSVYREGTYH